MTEPVRPEPAVETAAPSEPQPRSTARRVLLTVFAVTVTALVVAYPLFFAALIAVIEWTGCFIECREPDPNRAGATAAALVAVLLLGLPVLAGVLSWRGSSRPLLLVYLSLALLAAFFWVLGVAI